MAQCVLLLALLGASLALASTSVLDRHMLCRTCGAAIAHEDDAIDLPLVSDVRCLFFRSPSLPASSAHGERQYGRYEFYRRLIFKNVTIQGLKNPAGRVFEVRVGRCL